MGLGLSQYRNRYRMWQNRRLIESYSNREWMEALRQSQFEILHGESHPHYRQYMNEEIHYWIHIAEWLSEESKRRDVSNVLDIGGAYGTLSVYCQKLFGNEIYCSDFMDEYLSRQLIEKYNIHFKVNNIELDPLPWDRKFDMIIFTEILEHLNFHPVPTLRKIRDSLSDDGVLFLSTPDASQWGRVTKYYPSLSEIPEPLRGQPVIDDHVWQYEKDELLTVVDAAGFKVLKFDYSPGLLNRHFNLMLAKSD